jgi:four helix bundle protein
MMQFGHEQLDVYRLSVEYVAWSYALAKGLNGFNRHARDQLLRAAQSIPLNIAEGNGKGTNPDRRRFFEIARGSTLECAAIQDCLEACQVLSPGQNRHGKTMLLRIVSMLTKLGQRNHELREDSAVYGDCDYDNDNDNEEKDDVAGCKQGVSTDSYKQGGCI